MTVIANLPDFLTAHSVSKITKNMIYIQSKFYTYLKSYNYSPFS